MPTFDLIREQAKDFFYYIGVLITDWAQIDEHLFKIFSGVLETKPHLAAILYYRTNTLSGRLQMTSELVHTLFPKYKSGEQPSELEKTWRILKNAIEDALEIRNQLAHSPASPQAEFSPNPTDPNKPPVITDVWWASYTSGTEKMRGKPAKQDLKLDDIKTHLKEVTRLYMEIRTFWTRLPREPVTIDQGV